MTDSSIADTFVHNDHITRVQKYHDFSSTIGQNMFGIMNMSSDDSYINEYVQRRVIHVINYLEQANDLLYTRKTDIHNSNALSNVTPRLNR